ncbi:hypothetical protein ILYODFUR_011541 [Ilyodon furcidens]|uniref:Uncharacterized protein n=1 Tax=Ilyodon furcidens TaxID=33524 RepID=A0ABV0SXS0_9TELE
MIILVHVQVKNLITTWLRLGEHKRLAPFRNSVTSPCRPTEQPPNLTCQQEMAATYTFKWKGKGIQYNCIVLYCINPDPATPEGRTANGKQDSEQGSVPYHGTSQQRPPT